MLSELSLELPSNFCSKGTWFMKGRQVMLIIAGVSAMNSRKSRASGFMKPMYIDVNTLALNPAHTKTLCHIVFSLFDHNLELQSTNQSIIHYTRELEVVNHMVMLSSTHTMFTDEICANP